MWPSTSTAAAPPRCGSRAGAPSTGEGFGSEVVRPSLSDGAGWHDNANYSTIRFADILGDGTKAVCARADAGIQCWRWEGDRFGDPVEGGLADATGWFRERFFRTIRFADVTGDGRDDLCARASAGLRCWPSTGDGFASDPVVEPAWSDTEGWDEPGYYSTLRLATAPPLEEDDELALPGDNDGISDDVGDSPDAGGDESPDPDVPSPSGPGSVSTSSCVCSASPSHPADALPLLLLFLAGLWMIRRPSPSS